MIQSEEEKTKAQGGEISIGGRKGWNSMRPDQGESSVGRILHQGTIYAPSGEVTLNAREQAYLEDGSLIDVSGVWVERSGNANTIEAQLNSVQLRDDYGQKDGVLQGEWITAVNTNLARGGRFERAQDV